MPKRSKRKEDGVGFERAVAAVQRLMDPNATVTHNEILTDRLGHRRQFDVVLRSKMGGHELLGVIECKDWKRRVGPSEINAFADKARNVRANLTLFVARRGFTEPALELAKHHGIGTLSLVKEDHKDKGFAVGVPLYAVVYRWGELRLTLHFASAVAPLSSFSIHELRCRGDLVLDWIYKELGSTYLKEPNTGQAVLHMDFSEPVEFEVGEVACRLAGLTVAATRIREKRTKQVRWVGKAFYDWNRGAVMIPPNATLTSEGWRSNFSDWDLYDGDIPPLRKNMLFDMRFEVYESVEAPDTDLRLEELGEVTYKPPPVEVPAEERIIQGSVRNGS